MRLRQISQDNIFPRRGLQLFHQYYYGTTSIQHKLELKVSPLPREFVRTFAASRFSFLEAISALAITVITQRIWLRCPIPQRKITHFKTDLQAEARVAPKEMESMRCGEIFY
jgi:hypothetical protein